MGRTCVAPSPSGASAALASDTRSASFCNSNLKESFQWTLQRSSRSTISASTLKQYNQFKSTGWDSCLRRKELCSHLSWSEHCDTESRPNRFLFAIFSMVFLIQV